MLALKKRTIKKQKLLLVTGTGRSGTTMLRNAVGSHENVYYRGKENNIFLDLLNTCHHNCTYPSRKVAMELPSDAYNALVKKTLFAFLFPEPKQITSKHKYVQCYSALDVAVLPYLKEIFPDIYILQIVRNGIAVVSSRMHYKGFQANDFHDHIQKWNRGVAVSEACKTMFKEQYKLVKHEDFLSDESIHHQAEGICKWLGLSDSASIYNTIKKNQFHPTTIKEESKNASIKNRADRWQYWTKEQQQLFKDSAAKSMDCLNYEIPF